jgi:hypothetical protein
MTFPPNPDPVSGSGLGLTMAVIGFIAPNQVGQMLRVTTTSLSRWDGSAWVNIAADIFTGGITDYFSFAGWGEKLLMTNGVDKVYSYNTQTGEKGFIAESFPAKHIQSFGNRVILSGTKEGEYKPYRIRWSVKNDSDDYTGDGSGFEDLYAAPGGVIDTLHGCFPITDDTARLVREHTLWQMSLTGIVLAPFRFTRTHSEMGTRARRSITEVPGGHVFIGKENVIIVGFSEVKPIGDAVRTDLLDSITDWEAVISYYDHKRNELRIINGNTIWRYSFRTPGWTKDIYPELIRHVAYIRIDTVGLKIDDLVGKINALGANYPPGKINDLTADFALEGLFFVTHNVTDSMITKEVVDVTTDVDIDEAVVEAPIVVATALLAAGSPLDRTKVIEIQLEYESDGSQTLLFEYSTNAGVTWSSFSSKAITATTGPTVLAVRKTLVGHNIQLRLKSATLGQLRVLAFIPHIVQEAKVNV